MLVLPEQGLLSWYGVTNNVFAESVFFILTVPFGLRTRFGVSIGGGFCFDVEKFEVWRREELLEIPN